MNVTPVERLLTTAYSRRVFSGAAWSYGDAGGAHQRGVVGTLTWEGLPVDVETLWDLASLTKPIVALAVMSLMETGELTLDDTTSDHLPDYRATDKAGITVRDLLTHTSGIPGQIPLFHWNPNRESMLAAIRSLPLDGPPGAHVRYTSQGFIILGLMCEAASGMPLDTLVRRRVLDPASMPRTTYTVAPEDVVRTAATEDDPWRGTLVQGEVHDENAVTLGAPAGHAGLFSTLGDMERLAHMLCAFGRGATQRVLAESTFRRMITPRTDHLNLRRCYGWQGVDATHSPAGDIVSPTGFGHTGFTGTSLWIDPETRRYALLLTNRVHPRRDGKPITRVRRAFNNIAFSAS